MNSTNIDAVRFGPLRLAPGVRPGNMLTYLYAAFIGVALNSFISVIMPYVLHVNIGLPADGQGRVVGDLVFYGELVMISMSGFMGAWSDKYGRRAVIVIGLLVLGVGYIALGMARDVPQLIAVRLFITFGIAAVSVMLATIQVDYPAEESRGKLSGFAGIAIGLGVVMIGVLFTRFPDMYAGMGYSELDASQMTMLTVTGVCVLSALLLRIGLVGGPPSQVNTKRATRKLIADGINAGRRNPRLLLAYACGFVGRADLVVVGTFYSLWLTQAGIASGMGADVAAKMAGGMFAFVMTCALIWAPVMGWLNDRIDRTLALALALILGLIGYCSIGFVNDPFGVWLYPASVLLGIGQMSVTLASQTLLGQESPPEMRGAVVGTFSICGAAGILFVTGVGGRLYDVIAPAAPFVMIGLLNGLLGLYGFWLYRKLQTGVRPQQKSAI
jgi:MFS family permease